MRALQPVSQSEASVIVSENGSLLIMIICHLRCILSIFNMVFIWLGDSKRSPGGYDEYAASKYLALLPVSLGEASVIVSDHGRSLIMTICHLRYIISIFNMVYM